MIDKERLNIDWIEKVSKANRDADKILVEKAIRAFLLLEGLALSDIPFVFKGGTSLMLMTNPNRRLSVDIDIVRIRERVLREILQEITVIPPPCLKCLKRLVL